MKNDNKVFVKNKELKKTEYLFGIQPNVFKKMNYVDVLYLKLKGASDVLDELQEVHYLQRDDERIINVLKAIEHTRKLIIELGLNPSKKDSKSHFSTYLKWIFGTLFGVIGAMLVAFNIVDYSKFGFLLFLVSAVTFGWFAYKQNDKPLLFIQIVFVLTNLIGIYRWF